MFKLVANPTFTLAASITRPGEDQPGRIDFTCVHLANREFAAWHDRVGAQGLTDAQWLSRVISGWSGPVDQADQPVPYSEQALDQLFDQFPAAAQEFYQAYVSARLESRAKNSERR